MKRNFILGVYSALTLMLGSSCLDQSDVYNPERVNQIIESSFDFSSMVTCPIEISVGRQALIRIYTENPEKTNNPQQIYAAYTDKDGKYKSQITLASEYIGKTLYAGAYGINIPTTASATGLKFSAANNQTKTRSLEPDVILCEKLRNNFIDRLPETHNNTGQLENVDNINLKVTQENTEVLFSFIFSGASRTSQIYYYYYPTDFNGNKVPEDKENVARPGSQNYFYNESKGYGDYEKIIARFKNDKFLLTKGYGDNGYINEGIKKTFSAPISFYGEDGTNGTGSNFPQGYSIGFFIISSWPDVYEPIFTDWWCNSHQNGGIKHSTNSWAHNNKQAVRFKDSDSGKIIFGFEDIALNETIEQTSDFDYNDFLFLVTTNPEIDKEEIPELNEDITESKSGTLLYEDLYPSQGDYDMNDVIIEYTYTKHFNQNNILTKIDYEFTPVHDGAFNISDFSLMIDKCVTTPILIFQNHKNAIGQTFTGSITTEVVGKQKDDVTWEDFNPFITIESNNREVHLTKKSPSANANTNGLNDLQLSYISNDKGLSGEYPFAMDIPIKGFKIVTEKQRIDDQYPQYKKWVKSNKQECADWYNHYKEQ